MPAITTPSVSTGAVVPPSAAAGGDAGGDAVTVSAGRVTVLVNSPDRIACAIDVSRRRAFTVVRLKKP